MKALALRGMWWLKSKEEGNSNTEAEADRTQDNLRLAFNFSWDLLSTAVSKVFFQKSRFSH